MTSRRIEVLIVAAIAIAGFLIGTAYERTFRGAGLQAHWVQQEFAAAVALGCGRGFVNVGQDAGPQMHSFVLLERDTFDCASLPADAPRNPPNLTQGLYRYLMWSVAALWLWHGVVSWSVLGPLFGVCYALTLMCAYGLFRFAMGRTIAIVMTAAVAVSPVHLGYLVYLRDYAKAPFILALILIMLWLAADAANQRRALVWSAAFGLVLGIGFGFRNDILIAALPFAAVVALFVGRHDLRGWMLKAACLLLAVAVFVVTAWPILAAYSRGSNSGHVALLGMSPFFNESIGVNGSIYGWGYGYWDGFAAGMVNDYTIRKYGHDVAYLSAEYDQRMVEQITAIARQWPADMLVRTYTAAGSVLQFPFAVGAYGAPIPPGIQASPAVAIFNVDAAIRELLTGSGVWFVGGALLLVASQSTAAAAALSALLVYFAGYPVVQFDIRHFFHLEFIPWLAIGYLLQRAADLARRPPPAGASWRRALVFAAGALAVVVVPVVILRIYQASHIRHLIATDYVAAPRQRLDLEVTPAGRGRTRLALPSLWADRDRRFPIAAEYLAVTLGGSHCDVDQLTITFRYTAKTADTDFTQAVTASVLPGSVPTQIFFPGYFSKSSELTSLETATPDVPCIEDVSRVARSSLPPLLLNLTLTPHWQSAKLFQTVQALEMADWGDGAPLVRYAVPHDALGSLFGALPVSPKLGVSPSAGSGWRIQFRPPSAYAQMAEFGAQRVAAGDALVVEGELAAETPVTIGTQKDGRWVSVVNIVKPGPFVATLTVPEAGDHTVVIADARNPSWIAQRVPWLYRRIPSVVSNPLSTDLVIKRIGWARANGEQ